jgi:hypothetical protein
MVPFIQACSGLRGKSLESNHGIKGSSKVKPSGEIIAG